MKQEKYQLAEYHFRRALEINPRNSVLHCYRGMALLSNRTYDQAIAVLQKAKEMDPGAPSCCLLANGCQHTARVA